MRMVSWAPDSPRFKWGPGGGEDTAGVGRVERCYFRVRVGSPRVYSFHVLTTRSLAHTEQDIRFI